MGRPSDYSADAVTAICAEIACGKSIREICRAEGMPDMSTVFRWLGKHIEFQEQYARAREAQADFLGEEMLEIADDGTNDWIERQDKDGKPIGYLVNGEAVQRSRLRVDARKWLMSKLQPKKYGDKIAQEITGKDGGPVAIEDTSPVESARRIAFVLGKALRAQETA